mgnify:CR=1 FL=1
MKISALALLLLTFSLVATPTMVVAESVEQLFEQSKAAYLAGKYAQAEALYRHIIELEPNNAFAYYKLCYVLDDQDKLDDAVAACRKSTQLNSKNALGFYILGYVLSRQNKLADAAIAFDRAIQLNPKFTLAYYSLGVALLDQGELAAAMSAYRTILTLPNDLILSVNIHALAHNAIGGIFKQQNQLEEAIPEFEEAIRIDPNFIYAQNNLKEARRSLQIQAQGEILDDTPWLPENDPSVPILRPVVLIVANFSSRQRQGAEKATGIVIQREGDRTLIITNRHVVYDQQSNQISKNIRVEFFSNPPEGTLRMRRKAKLLAMTNPEDRIDLAVLEVIGDLPEDIQPLPIADTPISRGMPVIAIANPLRGLPWSTLDGKISSYNHQQIQISGGAISPGSSGGAIINSQNQLVGIIVEANGDMGFAYTTKTIIEKMHALGIE